MIGEGAEAPTFELPAVEAGEVAPVSLADFFGREIVVLAFYPGDFNPACGDGTTDLDELDLFTMQKDVSILAISTDSIFSHRAFADEFDLHVPLLADTTTEVTEAYGLGHEYDDGQYLPRRAVVVVGPEGEVQYAWSTANLTELAPVEEIREAIDSIGGADTAQARYRVGHAHYVEGRRAFTSAIDEFGEDEWMTAQSEFTRAYEEFDEAADHFNTALRFAEDEIHETCFDRAEEKAELLWQVAEWLTDAASAFASGEGAEGQARREDAETPLESARRMPEPPDPDEFPLDELPEAPEPEPADDGTLSARPTEETPSLDVDIDEAADGAEAETGRDVDPEPTPADGTKAEAERNGRAEGGKTAGAAATDASADGTAGDDETAEADRIDEAELEEITAELEEQTREAEARREDESADDESAPEDGPAPETEAVDPSADSHAEGDEEFELDLADPTDGEDPPGEPAAEDDDDDGESESSDDDGGASQSLDDDLGSGSSPVPDSL